MAVRVVKYVINYLNSGKLKTECNQSMALSQENLTFDNTSAYLGWSTYENHLGEDDKRQCNRGLIETFRVLNKSVHSNVCSQVNNYSENHEKAQTERTHQITLVESNTTYNIQCYA